MLARFRLMQKLRWPRIVLAGIATGVIWDVLNAPLLAIFAADFLAAVDRLGRTNSQLLFAVDLAMGIWTVWLYAAIRPRFTLWTRAAATAGFAWWLIKSLQSVKWVSLGILAPDLTAAPLLITLVTAVLATLAGGRLYGD